MKYAALSAYTGLARSNAFKRCKGILGGLTYAGNKDSRAKGHLKADEI